MDGSNSGMSLDEDGNEPVDQRGSRAVTRKLGEALARNLAVDFAEHGKAAIAAVRGSRPLDYLKLVASLVSKQDVDQPDVVIGRLVFRGINDDETLAREAAEKDSRSVSTSDAADTPPLLPANSEHWTLTDRSPE